MEDLNILRDKAYNIAIEHGWHDKEYSNEHCLCLVISELAEAVEADRKGFRAEKDKFSREFEYVVTAQRLCGGGYDRAFISNFDRYIKDTVEDELADACIRLFDLAGLRKINLSGINFPIACGQEHLENRRKMTFTEWSYDVIQVIARFDKNHYPIGYLIIGILQEICCKAKMMGFDILWHVEEKMKYNVLRPYMHGDKAY